MVDTKNVRESYAWVKAQLCLAGIEDAGFEADILVSFVAQKSRFLVDVLTMPQWEQLQQLVSQRIKRVPLQYLLGTWEFMGLSLAVGEGVLVPRPETEEVCEVALLAIQNKAKPVVLDLCSGTGAIALGIQSRRQDARITAVELSDKAFAYLQKNVKCYKQQWGVVPLIEQADIFLYQQQLQKSSVDLIVSNPPYVTSEEYKALEPELYFEPEMALVEPIDGLCFYRHIAEKYRPVLRENGWIVFEIGASQGEAVCQLLQVNGYSVIELLYDIAGNARCVKAKK